MLLLFLIVSPSVRAQRLRDFVTPQPLPEGSTLVVGFLGGIEPWNDAHRGVRKVTLDLRALRSQKVFAETVENRHVNRALEFIYRALDTNGDGILAENERASARLILFGQSLGGAAAIRTARVLNQWGVPVLLTVQVDSFGRGDDVIPANVSKAANFYQRGPFTIRGRRQIRAQDPRRTQILGNVLRAYPLWVYSPQDRANASWGRLVFGGGHARMETDPALWGQVEQLMLDAIAGSSHAQPTLLSSRP